jgi:hypothetical protein
MKRIGILVLAGVIGASLALAPMTYATEAGSSSTTVQSTHKKKRTHHHPKKRVKTNVGASSSESSK